MSGCVVLPMLCLGSLRSLTLEFGEPVALAPGSSRGEFAAANLPVLARILEDQIRAHPDQWELWTKL